MIHEKIRVVIADDHDVYRDGLKALLHKDHDIEVVGEASNGKELIEITEQTNPDVVLADLIMPGIDGIEAIKQIRRKGFTRILALSTFDSERFIVTALEAGAKGYIIKNAKRGEIITAVKMMYKYQPYYCTSTSARLAMHIGRSTFNPYNRENQIQFTEREKEIIRLICQEKSSEEIGKNLFMSKRTVDGIRARLLAKMNVKTTAGVAIFAVKNSIFLLEDGNYLK